MQKFEAIKKASILGMIGNVFLLIIKGFVGIFTNSQAMLGDAFNSAGDIFSSIMTFIGNKIASKPRDVDHNLGHGKAEYIYSMLISIAMILMAYQVFKNSFFAFLFHKTYVFSIWLIVVCVTTIIIKFSLYLYTRSLYKKYHNLLLFANSKDHRNDCILTTLNLIACLFNFFGIFFVDSVVGIIISIWIFVTAVKIFVESYDVLMDKSIDDITKKKVYQLVRKHSEVCKISHFNSTPVGYQYQISFTIFVDGNLSTFDSHEIANTLEKEIAREIPEIYLTVIHVNPIKID